MITKRKTTNNRHEEIIKLIKNTGFVTVEEMATLYNVTPQTIRRDINFLDSEGFISRYHGGAGLSVSTENVAYRHRKEILLNEKSKIAKNTKAIFCIILFQCFSCQESERKFVVLDRTLECRIGSLEAANDSLLNIITLKHNIRDSLRST